MKSIQTSGKTVEDAIKLGLKELGCGLSDVRFDVLDHGSPGLFGMFGRLAKVQLTVKEDDHDFSFEMPTMTTEPLREERPRKKKNPDTAKPVEERKGADVVASTEIPNSSLAAKPVATPTPKPAATPTPVVAPAPTPVVKEAAPAPTPVVKEAAPAPTPAVEVTETPASTPVRKVFVASTPDVTAAPAPEMPTPVEKPRPERPAASPAPRAPRRPAPTRETGEGNEAESTARPRAPRGDRPRHTERPPRRPCSFEGNGPCVPVASQLPPLDLETLSDSGKKAYEFLRLITEDMGVSVEIRIATTENGLLISMTGDTLGILIGRRGETLDALQYLTSLVVNRGQETYTRITLDTENYRAKREDALRKLAFRMAGQVRRSGKTVEMEPMNPYERRILHAALQGNPYVETHSEGEEPYRHVIITPKS